MNDLKSFLDEKAEHYNHPDFVLGDPIQMPHRFELKQDIEIIGFLTATIAWGNRKSIIKSAEKMLWSVLEILFLRMIFSTEARNISVPLIKIPLRKG